jgi:hypothetical protein
LRHPEPQVKGLDFCAFAVQYDNLNAPVIISSFSGGHIADLGNMVRYAQRRKVEADGPGPLGKYSLQFALKHYAYYRPS